MRTYPVLSLLISLALLVASCNSGSDSTSSAETAAPQTNTSTTARPTTIADLSTTTTSLPASSPTTTPQISTTTLPANRATAITAGSSHSCALRQDGAITCWGSNEQGQLGNGTSGEDADSSVPVRVTGITDTTAITAGHSHSCALHQNGTITCWGSNGRGQLGNGTDGEDADSSVPVRVTGITDATAITTAGAHTCALHQTGAISCWGSNQFGQLGNGTNGEDADSSVPVRVNGITDATAITTGIYHSCALHQNGTITCWGNNGYGQLGNGTTQSSSVPVGVLDITDATAITAGGGFLFGSHSCALHQTGVISCWGENSNGQLGNGQSGEDADSSVPVRVNGITNATAITTGWEHSCALHQDGTISCWGSNDRGRLGTGQSTVSLRDDSADPSGPVRVNGITDATAITTGWDHSCALHQTGAVSCWGANGAGQLGNSQSTGYWNSAGDWKDGTDSSVPVEVDGITDITAITASGGHSCALHQDGAITCWGNNWNGQLGNGATSYFSSVPVEVDGITDATAITAGWGHSCALHQTDAVSCWGANSTGQLGNGQSGEDADSSVPVRVTGITDATAITASGNEFISYSCALHQTGAVSCWGANSTGQLGNGQSGEDADSSVPVRVTGITDATAITASGLHTCALHQDGAITCWGDNAVGQLGNGTKNNFSSVPVGVQGITDATAITTGGGIIIASHSCALHQTGSMSCWGNNTWGQLGIGQSTGYWQDDTDSSVPVRVNGITDATAITAGDGHTCALHQTGTITCWGILGGDIFEPLEVEGISDATAITAGLGHSCALHQTGTVSCWGSNGGGQLGNGVWLPQFVVGLGG